MLTYKERIDKMRQKKIEDTLKKREQNGYTDLDDFGTGISSIDLLCNKNNFMILFN